MMARRIPLARKNLLQDRRRAALAVGGVAASLVLVLAGLPDTTVQTRAEFARQQANVVRDMAADVMKIVTVIGFVIAVVVTGLTLFTATLAKLREYGILKALGAGTPRLAATVAAQAAWSVALALVAAVAVSMLLGAATPNVQVAIEPASVLRTGSTALIVGALASLVPLRRVLCVDPAIAFRRP
jgi:putative ABC transport system permease protein